MEKRIGIVGHVGGASAGRVAAILSTDKGQTIHEVMAQQETYTIEDTYKDTRMGTTVRGFENTITRRERRANERKTKKKWK